MTTWLVTRHEGTRTWANTMAKHGRLPFTIDRIVDHLDVESLAKGDVVVGTLPVHMAAELHERKVAFWSLDLDTPRGERGKELTGVQLMQYGARFTRYEVRERETQEVAAARQRKQAAAKSQPSITLIPVSEQLAPAAIGWLHQCTEQVALLATPRMQVAAKRLKAWFDAHPQAPQTTIMRWDDATYDSLLKQAELWAAGLAGEARPLVVINLTGGTKPMAMALQRAFGRHRASFSGALRGGYVDTEHRAMVEMLDDTAADAPLRSALNIDDLLTLQGMTITAVQSAHRDYTRWLDRGDLFELLLAPKSQEWLAAWYQLLGHADWLVNPRKNRSGKRQAGDATVNVTSHGKSSKPRFLITVQKPKQLNWRGLSHALKGRFGELLVEAGVCTFSLSETSLDITFPRTALDELAFATGGWLEAWLASQFNAFGIDEWAQGVTVKRGRTENEFDIIAVCGNQTLVVEAKTATLTREGRVDSRGTETVYKLDALADKLGKAFNQRWLVTLRSMDPIDQERATRHQIKVFHGGAAGQHIQTLADLPNAIQAWMDRCNLAPDPAWQPSAFPAAR